jgi:tripartite-type tricarboxylate transporter receptor subunit TctC
MSRRKFLPLTIAAGAIGYYGRTARAYAGAYPSQTITFLIPDGIGGGASTYVREYAVLLGQHFNPTVNVEPFNDQGANGQKAALDLFRAAPDGYTIGMLGDVTAVRQDNDLLNKLTWIANLGRSSFGLAVNAKSNIKSVLDIQKLSQQRPVVFTSSGSTALSYFATQLFCKLNGIRARIITGYKGASDSMVAVMSGEADATAQSLPTLGPMERAGLLRTMFAYADKSPIPGVEDATSIGQPDLAEIIQWRFVAGPPGLPQSIVGALANGLQRISSDPATVAWSEKVSVPIYYLGPEATKKAVDAQLALVEKWQGML